MSPMYLACWTTGLNRTNFPLTSEIRPCCRGRMNSVLANFNSDLVYVSAL